MGGVRGHSSGCPYNAALCCTRARRAHVAEPSAWLARSLGVVGQAEEKARAALGP